jgi:hypothetical protein
VLGAMRGAAWLQHCAASHPEAWVSVLPTREFAATVQGVVVARYCTRIARSMSHHGAVRRPRFHSRLATVMVAACQVSVRQSGTEDVALSIFLPIPAPPPRPAQGSAAWPRAPPPAVKAQRAVPTGKVQPVPAADGEGAAHPAASPHVPVMMPRE